MKRHRLKLLVHVSAALLVVSFLAGPASAQSGLGTRLDEAGQKLDSDTQSCRTVNLAEYATLLNEAMANKQRAAKAAKKGIPVDQAQVDADLSRASMLFARAQSAQVMQCMRAAQQPAQPQTQTTPQSAGSAPAAPPVARPQGVTSQDEQAVARQQGTIEDFEASLDELRSLVKAGKCKAAWDLVDDLDDWLDYLDRPLQVTPASSAAYGPRVPGTLIDEWDDRIDDLVKDCPRPGMLDYKQVRIIIDTHNAERAQYGLEPFRWSPKLEQHAFAYANELMRTGQMSHAPREGRGTERENLSQGLPWWSVQNHLESWRQEKKKFKPGIFPNVSFTGNWYEVGHWTQWIWQNTTAVGCAMAVGGPASWFVCRYNPGGNKDGVPVGMTPTRVAVAQRAPPQARKPPPIAISSADFSSPDERTELKNLIDSVGDEMSISGFVGGGLGIARVSFNNRRTFGLVFDDQDALADVLNHVRTADTVGGDDTRIDQPDVSHFGSQFSAGTKASKTLARQTDKESAGEQMITVPASTMFFIAERNYRAAKNSGNVALMNATRANMQAAIAWVRDILDQATVAGDLGVIKPSTVRIILNFMIPIYNLATTGTENGILSDTNVEQPKLPNTEPFKTPEPKPGDLDPG